VSQNEHKVLEKLAAIEEALSGKHGPGQESIAREVVHWGDLLLRKNRDYGDSAWQRPLLAPDCDPGVAIRVRMSDKLNRLISLLSRPAEVSDESIDDTLRDLGAYCLLELARPGRLNHPVATWTACSPATPDDLREFRDIIKKAKQVNRMREGEVG
jgi:hypothetical protein